MVTSCQVREHNLYLLKGSLPFPTLQTRPKPPGVGVTAKNLEDLKGLRLLLLDFISWGPDSPGPHLGPRRL
ncbi:hypothetical protein GH733_010609 [Mirounga leonina]|nr:hypothetical protein GH733_010609 [Mirounga leonina]